VLTGQLQMPGDRGRPGRAAKRDSQAVTRPVRVCTASASSAYQLRGPWYDAETETRPERRRRLGRTRAGPLVLPAQSGHAFCRAAVDGATEQLFQQCAGRLLAERGQRLEPPQRACSPAGVSAPPGHGRIAITSTTGSSATRRHRKAISSSESGSAQGRPSIAISSGLVANASSQLAVAE